MKLVNTPEFCDLPPSQIVPRLADQGIYAASERSLYRILEDHKMKRHRGPTRPRRVRPKPRPLTATRPNQVWSWDISYLPSSIRGTYFYLYFFLDIYSRKIVSWNVLPRETSEAGAALLRAACVSEGVKRREIKLHSDNGAPMKGATMLLTMKELGVEASFNRPGVSQDNPYSESLFGSMKTRPTYPDRPFETLSEAVSWVDRFVTWYNLEHLHSGIQFVTPEARHQGRDREILAGRAKVYQEARERNPSRWTGRLRDWRPVECVTLNHVRGGATTQVRG